VANRVGAILIAGSGFVDPAMEAPVRDELERYTASGGRVAVIGRHHLRADTVQPDNTGGGRMVTEHVLELGHRRLAILSGSLGLTTVTDRLDGVHEAMRVAGVDPDGVPVIEETFTRDGGRAGAIRILEEHPDTTAVVALNDDMAIGCLSELRRARIAVPDRMTVTGFDDVAVAGDLAPGLTTIRLPMSDMGARALALALKEPGSRPRKQRVAAELVVRGSSGPARD
jgi:LacI family transcriptional regulator